jgi:hypothetical protein
MAAKNNRLAGNSGLGDDDDVTLLGSSQSRPIPTKGNRTVDLVAAFLTGLTGANTAEIAERARWTEDMKLAYQLDRARKRSTTALKRRSASELACMPRS